MSLTNLAEHEGALEDVKHKFVPLVMKWANEDQEIFNLRSTCHIALDRCERDSECR